MGSWCQLSEDELEVWDPTVEEGLTGIQEEVPTWNLNKFRASEGGMEVKFSQAGFCYFPFCIPQ